MALTATMYVFHVDLSDVDRGVYDTFELRLARHPSETLRYLLTRLFAYCLAYEEGIAFSKEGLSNADEPPLSVRDRTGLLQAWIDVGVPSAERLHKAAKAAPRVSVYTAADIALLQREAATRAIHKVDAIDVWRLDPALLDAVAERLGRTTRLGITRTDGALYVTLEGHTLEGQCQRASLVTVAS
jgi:uncharacterized protein YaeQ